MPKKKEKIPAKNNEKQSKSNEFIFDKNRNTLITIVAITALMIALFAVNNSKTNTKQPKVTYQSYGTATEISNFKDTVISDYQTYLSFTNYYEQKEKLTEKDFEKHDYLVLMPEQAYCDGDVKGIKYLNITGGSVEATFDIKISCDSITPTYEIYLAELEKNALPATYTVGYNYAPVNKATCNEYKAYKPIIYLYPEEKTEVIVRLGHPEKLTTTYPKYNDSWHVVAEPNGMLTELNTNRKLYALYWEGKNTPKKDLTEGFVIKGEDTATFLEEKLRILGLTDEEKNEFIIFWLPKMEKNKYNYIRFESLQEINDNMPLEISPKPDTIIRVMMDVKSLDEKLEVKPQELITPTREGFTVVEWGGTILE